MPLFFMVLLGVLHNRCWNLGSSNQTCGAMESQRQAYSNSTGCKRGSSAQGSSPPQLGVRLLESADMLGIHGVLACKVYPRSVMFVNLLVALLVPGMEVACLASKASL